MTIEERAKEYVANLTTSPSNKIGRIQGYIKGATEQREIDKEEIEDLQDRLDVLHMAHLSQVGLWKSRYKHALETVDEFWREEILTSLPEGVYQSWAIHKLEELKNKL